MPQSPATKTRYEDVVMFQHQHIRQGKEGVGASDESKPTLEDMAKHLQMVERLECMGVCQ